MRLEQLVIDVDSSDALLVGQYCNIFWLIVQKNEALSATSDARGQEKLVSFEKIHLALRELQSMKCHSTDVAIYHILTYCNS